MMPRLLIIDDSPEDREFLQDLAQQAGGLDVTAVSSGPEGLAHYAISGTDCVLLDYHLDGEDGLSVLSALRARASHLPILVLTGVANEKLIKSSDKLGANTYLIKENLTASSLKTAISAAIGEEGSRSRRGVLEAVGRRILLVEDNDDDREYIADMICDPENKLEVRAVATGDEALSAFVEEKIDCTILDYRLEHEDGLTILTRIKHISPFHPVIMLTGQGNEEVAASSIKAGASDYLIKQRLTRPYLKTAIENAMSRTMLEAKVAEQETERRRFLNILVHDLRAPLRNVRALGEFATEEAADGNIIEMESLLATQHAIAQRANDLIDALEIYALLDGEVGFEPVPLDDIVNAARSNLELTTSAMEAEFHIDDLPIVNGHQPQLVQLFQNIIQNGLKYNHSPQPKLWFEWKTPDTITVRDNGIGIPERFQKTIFSPLKRLWHSEEYEGTGLGLATCKKIVERHGGEIWCTSEEGVGTEFHIRLPVLSI